MVSTRRIAVTVMLVTLVGGACTSSTPEATPSTPSSPTPTDTADPSPEPTETTPPPEPDVVPATMPGLGLSSSGEGFVRISAFGGAITFGHPDDWSMTERTLTSVTVGNAAVGPDGGFGSGEFDITVTATPARAADVKAIRDCAPVDGIEPECGDGESFSGTTPWPFRAHHDPGTDTSTHTWAKRANRTNYFVRMRVGGEDLQGQDHDLVLDLVRGIRVRPGKLPVRGYVTGDERISVRFPLTWYFNPEIEGNRSFQVQAFPPAPGTDVFEDGEHLFKLAKASASDKKHVKACSEGELDAEGTTRTIRCGSVEAGGVTWSMRVDRSSFTATTIYQFQAGSDLFVGIVPDGPNRLEGLETVEGIMATVRRA